MSILKKNGWKMAEMQRFCYRREPEKKVLILEAVLASVSNFRRLAGRLVKIWAKLVEKWVRLNFWVGPRICQHRFFLMKSWHLCLHFGRAKSLPKQIFFMKSWHLWVRFLRSARIFVCFCLVWRPRRPDPQKIDIYRVHLKFNLI